MRKLTAILTDIRYSNTMPLYLSPTRPIESLSSSFRAKALVLSPSSPHAAPTCAENARPPHRRWGEERVKGRGELRSSLSLSLVHSLTYFRSAARTSRMGGYPTRWFFRLLASCVIYYSSLFFLRSLVDFLKFGWILIHEWEGKRTIFEWICIKDILEWTNWINF